MAKLHSYFVLCPLLDKKSFLGISSAKVEGDILVTLGRNVVNKYRLSDQKQVGGWTSKDHITAAVVYDQEQDNYVGVFNNNTIKLWKEDTESLEKVKKRKFSTDIFKLIKYENSTLVVFANGICSSLKYAIGNRKVCEEKPLLKNLDTIVNVATYTYQNGEYICYTVQNGHGGLEIVTCALQCDLGDLVRSKITKHKVLRNDADVKIIGKVITVEPFKPAVVYVLWSDAKVHAFDVTKSTWRVCGTVPWISTKSNYSMEWMGDKHLILFGSDKEQEGAILVAFNVVLGVGSCRYPMKMYCENAKLYCLHGRLILEAGNHLAMLPYALDTSRSLASLIGTHEILENDCIEVADWGIGDAPDFTAEGEFGEMLKKGMTEQSIVQQLLPTVLAQAECAEVLKVVKYFSTVPEDMIVKLLKYILKQFDNDVSILNDLEKFKVMYGEKTIQTTFLNHIFSLPFSDAVLIPHLRNNLTLMESLFLLTYVNHLLEDEATHTLEYERIILDWCSLLLDAFYQQYLMTSDQSVTNTLDLTHAVVTKLVKNLEQISDMLPMLHTLLSKNKDSKEREDTTLYSIEMIKF